MSTLRGVGGVIEFQLKRDRLWLPAWVLGNALVTYALLTAVTSTYGTPEAIAKYATTMAGSPASLMMSGRQAALDTFGGIAVSEATVISVIMISLMALFTVVRHTRSDEETGRAELLRSTAVGRDAIPVAALSVAVLASLVTGALNTLVFVAGGLPVVGSIGFGAGLALTGIVFAASSAAVAQVTATARGALGLGGALIGTMFIVRGIGAVNDTWWGWLTPFRWAQEVRPFGDERWWPLGLLVAATGIGLVLTSFLSSHRDSGAGLFKPRPGPRHGSRLLGTPIGFAARQQQGLAIGWWAGLMAVAALFGSISVDITESLASNPDLADLLLGTSEPGDVVDAFATFAFQILAILLTVFATASVLRLRTEEVQGRAESLLATALSRTRWVVGTLAATTIACASISVLIGLAFGGASSATSDGGSQLGVSILTALTQVPAALLVAAAAFAVWAWTRSPWGWALVALTITPTFLGNLLELPDWLSRLSPFWHTPDFPVSGAVPQVLAMIAMALAVGVVGIIGINRRDVGAS